MWHHSEPRAGIDELLTVRVMNKGDFYVHQDANWNVIALTNLRGGAGGAVVERYVYTPYGEVNVMQGERDRGGSVSAFGDRDGDEDVDSTDKGTVGVTCTGTVTGECRILDLALDTTHPALRDRSLRDRRATARGGESGVDGDYLSIPSESSGRSSVAETLLKSGGTPAHPRIHAEQTTTTPPCYVSRIRRTNSPHSEQRADRLPRRS